MFDNDKNIYIQPFSLKEFITVFNSKNPILYTKANDNLQKLKNENNTKEVYIKTFGKSLATFKNLINNYIYLDDIKSAEKILNVFNKYIKIENKDIYACNDNNSNNTNLVKNAYIVNYYNLSSSLMNSLKDLQVITYQKVKTIKKIKHLKNITKQIDYLEKTIDNSKDEELNLLNNMK